MEWTHKEANKVRKLKENHTWDEVAKIMNATIDKCRYHYKKADAVDSKVTIEQKANGMHVSERRIKATEEQLKDSNFVLLAHKYDPKHWEVVKHRSSMWEQNSNDNGLTTLFASRLEVKPKGNETSINDLIKSLQDIKPIEINIPTYKLKHERLLEIPLYDTHFGVSDYDYYIDTQAKINHLITSKVWKEIIFTVGSDMLHHDNMRSQTANNTPIEQVCMIQAWNDARKFYEPLIEKALKHSNKVKVYFIKGNHDESLSWSFTQMLKALYPQVEFDDTFEERKVHTFGKIFIGFTHGDKGRKNLHNIFPIEHATEWASAKVREIHVGHFHVEDGKDNFGTMVRTLATRNKTDKWHKDMGYVGAHKRFMVFEYSKKELESIHYV